MAGAMSEGPRIYAGCKMPSFAQISEQDALRRVQAEINNETFLQALYSYGARHGLPNISPAECERYLGRLWGYAR